MIIIDEHGDLVVNVTELEEANGPERRAIQAQEFRVSRRVLIDASPAWREMLSSLKYAEGSQDHVEFGDDPVQSIEILFRVLHDAVDEATYEAPIKEIWRLVAMVKKWRMKIAFLNSWYAKWYDKQKIYPIDEQQQRQLLFPCWRFDHAKGFARATEWLAYSQFGHITEANPSKFDDLHLPRRIISQLNAAKGRLRTILFRALERPQKSLLRAECKCKADTLWGYEKALFDTRVWPPEDFAKNTSMHVLLDRLERFKYKPVAAACMTCHQNYESIVSSAVEETECYFNGMCLDCMDRLKPKLRDGHEDYWEHNNFRAEDSWFEGCRIKHKQPSWYYSFMGRQEDKDHLQARETRRPHYDSDSDGFE